MGGSAGTDEWPVLCASDGRTSVRTVNAAGQISGLTVPEIASTLFGYDTRGRLATTTQGTFLQAGVPAARLWKQTYDPNGYLNGKTDPLGVAVAYGNDLAGRARDTTIPGAPDGGLRDIYATFDGDDNVTSEQLPSGAIHQFTFTPVDGLASYAPPSAGPGPWSTFVWLRRRRANPQ